MDSALDFQLLVSASTSIVAARQDVIGALAAAAGRTGAGLLAALQWWPVGPGAVVTPDVADAAAPDQDHGVLAYAYFPFQSTLTR